MYTRTVEQIIMSYAIRYNRLSDMVNDTFKNSVYSDCNEINIFIDITKMIRSLTDPNIIYTDKVSISANILNLCAHYRSFFRRGYGVESNIFLLYSKGEFNINRMYYPDYKFTDDFFSSDIIYTNLNMLKLVCPYLYNIEYIETTEEISSPLIEISKVIDKNIPNVLITKDIYNTTIAGSGGVIIFRPKKLNGEDLSYVITDKTILHQYQMDRKVKLVRCCNSLNPTLINFILALTKVPERNIKSRMNISTAINCLAKAVDDGAMLNKYVSDPLYTAGVLKKYTKSNIDCYEIEQRYKSLDMYQLWLGYRMNPSNHYKGMINLSNVDEINKISNEYYQKTPVDFPSLL